MIADYEYRTRNLEISYEPLGGLTIKISSVVDPGSRLGPDSTESLDPYPDSQSGSGSMRAKGHTKVEKITKFYVLKCWMFSFEG